MTVYLKKPLQIIPYTHRAYIYIWFWPTLLITICDLCKIWCCNCRWKKWDDPIPALQIPDDAQFSNIIIPTKDSAR